MACPSGIEPKADYAEAHNDLGNALREQGKIEDAVSGYRRALELRPDFPAALGGLVHQMQHMCMWDGLDDLSQRVIAVVESEAANAVAGLVPPFSFLSLPTPTTPANNFAVRSNGSIRT